MASRFPSKGPGPERKSRFQTKFELTTPCRGDKPDAWLGLIPHSEWAVYQRALKIAKDIGVPFMLGGGFALAYYTRRFRTTKDIDLIITLPNRDMLAERLEHAGYHDMYDTQPYDRGWIYRARRHEYIVDLIFGMANRRAKVTPEWFRSAPTITIRGEELEVLPLEYLFWMKLYVLQRDRCDWLDLLNLLYCEVHSFNWSLLQEKVGPDSSLIRSVIAIFDWICPARARQIPKQVRKWLHLPEPNPAENDSYVLERIKLIDTRSWFAAIHPQDQTMNI
jgi:hypothetical protein